MTPIDKLLDQHEAFCKALEDVSDLEVEVNEVDPSTDKDIAAVEKAIGTKVPDDVRAFWKRGFSNLSVCDDEGGVLVPAKFLSAKGALAQIKVAQGMTGGKYPPKDPELRWLRFGIPLQEEENYCFIDAGKGGEGVVRQMRFDGDPIDKPIAPNFTAFYEMWLAAGCFSYGNADASVFRAYWKKVSALVPIKMDPEKNEWLKHMGRYYENLTFPRGSTRS